MLVFVLGNVLPTIIVGTLGIVFLVDTIRGARSPSRTSLDKAALWGKLLVALVVLYVGWFYTQTMVEVDGAMCGSATNQWLYGVIDSGSKFDDPAEQKACSNAGLQSAIVGAGICLTVAVSWWTIKVRRHSRYANTPVGSGPETSSNVHDSTN